MLEDVGTVPHPDYAMAISCPGKSGCIIFWNNAASTQLHELVVANGKVRARPLAGRVAAGIQLGTSISCSTMSECMTIGLENLGQGISGTGNRPEVVKIVGSHVSSAVLPIPVPVAALASQDDTAALTCETTSYCLAIGTSYLQQAGLNTNPPQRAFADAIR